MKSKARLTGKPFEELIYKIYKELEPHANIKMNDRIKGVESGIDREIDISLRRDFAGHDILLIIQAKDHKKKADIKILGEFISVIQDVRASRGILICNAGFTETAKDYAKNRAIDLCTAHDAANIEWAGEIKIPVIRKQSIVTSTLLFPFMLTKEYKEKKNGIAGLKFKTGPGGIVLTGLDGKEIDYLTLLLNLWSGNKIELTPGEHQLTLDAYADIYDSDYTEPPRQAELKYTTKTRHYLKFMTPTDYRGVKNYVTEKFSPSFVEFSEAIPFYHDKTWQYIDDPKELPLDTVRLEVDIVHLDKVTLVKADWAK